MIGVYGAGGFLGKALVRVLCERGHNVKAVSRSFDQQFVSEFEGRVQFESVDVSDIASLKRSLEPVTVAYNLVSSVSPALGNTQLVADIDSNLKTNISFAEICAESPSTRLVFISSGGTVYGRPQQIPIPEDHPCNPISSYGLIKYCSEKYIQMLGETKSLDYVVVRLANPYGPGQVFKNAQGLIPALLQKYRDGEAVTIIGDGSAQRDFIYIDDAVDALEKIIGNDQISRNVINLGSGEGKSIMDVVTALEQALGETLEKQFVPDRATDVNANVLNISRAKELLLWAPRTDFNEGVARVVRS